MNKWETSFLREIVELDTNCDEKRNYSQCTDVIRRYCEEAGLGVEIYDSNHDGIPQPNIVARMDAGSSTDVLLCSHYDVVPAGDLPSWTRPPFALTIEGDRAYGRGVNDDKGNIVACVSAARELAQDKTSRVNYVILISPNEEAGGVWGIDYLVNGPPRVRGDFCIVVDSSPAYVSIGSSGVLAGVITVHGTQGHAGYPYRFNNAIHLSVPLLNVLLDYVDIRNNVVSRLPAPPFSPNKNIWGRFSLTMYHAGSRTNVIPGKAEISFDCRLIPEEDPEVVAAEFSTFFERAKEETCVDADLRFTTKARGWNSDPSNPFVKAFLRAVQSEVSPSITLAADLGGNDGHYFTAVGIPTACYGTLAEDTNIHGVDEFMRLADFENVKRSLIRFARTWQT
ncbi:MAG: M20/M25/M40 family metallo-hydrolase [Candidatus Thorarchaeota archaeon]